MTDHHDAQERRAARLGLQPARAVPCPCVVAGRPCQANARQACVCQRYRRVLDHARTWFDQDGRLVLTGEPYELRPRDVRDFATAMGHLGLSVSLSGRSMWDPGECLLVTVSRSVRALPDTPTRARSALSGRFSGPDSDTGAAS